jgi:hypothetical protein
VPYRFLRHRAAEAREQAAATVAVSVRQITTLIAHAGTLADRMESLPLPPDLELRRERQERVRRLRGAVTAGQNALRLRQAGDVAAKDSGASAS